MKKILSVIIAIAMVASLAAGLVLNSPRRLQPKALPRTILRLRREWMEKSIPFTDRFST